MMLYLLVGFGGFIGAIMRYSISQYVQNSNTFSGLPLGTILVNILGCFALGFFNSLLIDKSLLYRVWINIGILGAFTTFSTFSLESIDLFLAEEYLPAFLNVVLSCVLGFAALLIGRSAYEFIFLK